MGTHNFANKWFPYLIILSNISPFQDQSFYLLYDVVYNKVIYVISYDAYRGIFRLLHVDKSTHYGIIWNEDMSDFDWREEKSKLLEQTRGVSFEDESIVSITIYMLVKGKIKFI